MAVEAPLTSLPIGRHLIEACMTAGRRYPALKIIKCDQSDIRAYLYLDLRWIFFD
jgi:hypothetical protein